MIPASFGTGGCETGATDSAEVEGRSVELVRA